jgi:hypothetical protein
MISPCLCTATAAFVHRCCLQAWRDASINPQSPFRCDTCQFEYRIERLWWGELFGHKVIQVLLGLLIIGVAIPYALLVCKPTFLVLLALITRSWTITSEFMGNAFLWPGLYGLYAAPDCLEALTSDRPLRARITVVAQQLFMGMIIYLCTISVAIIKARQEQRALIPADYLVLPLFPVTRDSLGMFVLVIATVIGTTTSQWAAVFRWSHQHAHRF